MCDQATAVLEDCAGIHSRLDQVQAELNRAREIFKDVPYMQVSLDVQQLQIDSMRGQVRFAEMLAREASK